MENRKLISFGLVIDAIKLGKKCSFNTWTNNKKYIFLIDPYSNTQFNLTEKKMDGTLYPIIFIKNQDNSIEPYSPTNIEILNNCWFVLEEEKSCCEDKDCPHYPKGSKGDYSDCNCVE